VAISPDGVFALVADYYNNMIRHISISTAFVSTLAGSTSSGSVNGIGTNARFDSPFGVAISPDGSLCLVSETINNQVRQVDIVMTSEPTAQPTAQPTDRPTGKPTVEPTIELPSPRSKSGSSPCNKNDVSSLVGGVIGGFLASLFILSLIYSLILRSRRHAYGYTSAATDGVESVSTTTSGPCPESTDRESSQ
jgi:hypothetical protein